MPFPCDDQLCGWELGSFVVNSEVFSFFRSKQIDCASMVKTFEAPDDIF